jgi:hypothetical protein
MTGLLRRSLTPAEAGELAAFNAEVTDAIERRRAWLDGKMHELSTLQVGDGIYDLITGSRLGTVSALYRYWRTRDDGVRDTTLSCAYEYEQQPHVYRNTSSQPYLLFGTQEDAERRSR